MQRSLGQLPFVTVILFQAQEYALRAFDLAKEQKLSVREQNSIQDVLNLISAEEAHPITQPPGSSRWGLVKGS